MAVFRNNAITDAGRSLLSHVQMGAVFTPTKIVLGSGYIPAGQTARSMTDVVSVVANLNVSKIERNNAQAIFGGVYSNQEIADDWDFRELALYAKAVYASGVEVEECLYSYGNAGDDAERMPAYAIGQPVERSIDLLVYIGQDSIVNLTIESGIYATRKGTVKHNTVTLTPESTGFATLLEYMASNYDTVPVECATVRGFSDLPNSKWAYQATINLKSGLLSVQLTDLYQVHTRVTNSRTEWLGGWTSYLHSNMTIEVGAGRDFESLQAAIDSVPKDLGGHDVTIYVHGSFVEDVRIEKFTHGTLYITGLPEAWAQLTGNLIINNNLGNINLVYFVIVPHIADGGTAIHVYRSRDVKINYLSLLAEGDILAGVGVMAGNLSDLYLANAEIRNVEIAVSAVVGHLAAETLAISNCQTGIYTVAGSVTVFASLIDATVKYVTNDGGRIYSGSQIDAPNY